MQKHGEKWRGARKKNATAVRVAYSLINECYNSRALIDYLILDLRHRKPTKPDTRTTIDSPPHNTNTITKSLLSEGTRRQEEDTPPIPKTSGEAPSRTASLPVYQYQQTP